MCNLALRVSQLALDVDGMDQAKFALPRRKVQTHEFAKIYRPRLHIQGAWIHGFGYWLAVLDADMKHDSANNAEVMSRALQSVYQCHQGLPLGLRIQQDNTCRECLNQKIFRWATKLVALGSFMWVTLSYFICGHTHGPLDGTYGAVAVRLAEYEFDDDMGLLEVLNRIIARVGVDRPSQQQSKAYKLDEAADWGAWWDEIDFRLKNHTGPKAGHEFTFCRRSSLGLLGHEGVHVEAYPGRPSELGADVVMVAKARMHHSKPFQALTMLPAASQQRLSVQPTGLSSRRSGGEAIKDKIVSKAETGYRMGAISGTARDYLVDWAQGTRRRAKRPEAYSFLAWQHRGVSPGAGVAPVVAIAKPLAQSVRGGAEPARILLSTGRRLQRAEESGSDPHGLAVS